MGKIQLSLLVDDLVLVTERDEDTNRSGNIKIENDFNWGKTNAMIYILVQKGLRRHL